MGTLCNIHRKRSFSIFPSPAGMSPTKLSMGGNNKVINKLFPPRESLVSDIPAGDGNIEKLFLRCTLIICYCGGSVYYINPLVIYIISSPIILSGENPGTRIYSIVSLLFAAELRGVKYNVILSIY